MNEPSVVDAAVVDPHLVEWTPGPSLELAPEVSVLRASLERAGRQLLSVPDERLEAVWRWPGSTSEVDVRYGYYRLFELLERARASVVAALASSGALPAPGGRLGTAATVARWSLHGLLLPLSDADLDSDPGNGEWTVRQTMGHMLQSQQFYGSFTAWWLTQAPTPGAIPPVALTYLVPSEDELAAGSVDDIRGRLDALLDLAMARLGGLDDDQVAVPARWSGGDVTVGFRIGRWASHIREHTIQIEKTYVMLGRPMTEVERLVRLIFEAYGRLEETVFGLDAASVGPAGAVLAAAADDVSRLVPGIAAAADAAVAPES
jgi:DinB family protein